MQRADSLYCRGQTQYLISGKHTQVSEVQRCQPVSIYSHFSEGEKVRSQAVALLFGQLQHVTRSFW